MLANVGFIGFRSDVAIIEPSSAYSDDSGTSSLPKLLLRSREEEEGLTCPDMLLLRLAFRGMRRNIWTVSVADETHNSVEVELKDILYIRAGIDPLRNW